MTKKLRGGQPKKYKKGVKLKLVSVQVPEKEKEVLQETARRLREKHQVK